MCELPKWSTKGKEDSRGAPWANLHLGLPYTGYNRFMGGSSSCDDDGNVRWARDNNALTLFLWPAV